MYFTEKLITEVRKYPCIWDQGADGYKENDVRSSCWLKVAEAIYSDDWANLKYAERKEKGIKNALINEKITLIILWCFSIFNLSISNPCLVKIKNIILCIYVGFSYRIKK